MTTAIRHLKSQLAGETRAREAAELRVIHTEIRAEKAERAERESHRVIQELRRQLQQMTAAVQSRGADFD